VIATDGRHHRKADDQLFQRASAIDREAAGVLETRFSGMTKRSAGNRHSPRAKNSVSAIEVASGFSSVVKCLGCRPAAQDTLVRHFFSCRSGVRGGVAMQASPHSARIGIVICGRRVAIMRSDLEIGIGRAARIIEPSRATATKSRNAARYVAARAVDDDVEI